MFYFDAFIGGMIGTLIFFIWSPVILRLWDKVFEYINRE